MFCLQETCDLLELSRIHLPDFHLLAETERLCRLKVGLTDEDEHGTENVKKRGSGDLKYLGHDVKTRRPFGKWANTSIRDSPPYMILTVTPSFSGAHAGTRVQQVCAPERRFIPLQTPQHLQTPVSSRGRLCCPGNLRAATHGTDRLQQNVYESRKGKSLI